LTFTIRLGNEGDSEQRGGGAFREKHKGVICMRLFNSPNFKFKHLDFPLGVLGF